MPRQSSLIRRTAERMFLTDDAQNALELFIRCKMKQLQNGADKSRQMVSLAPEDNGLRNQQAYYNRAVSTCEWLISESRKSFGHNDPS